MNKPLMPKATAVWLVENTSLSFEQIADFCGLHRLEVQGIADGEVATGIHGMDPVANNQLTKEELERCQADPSASLQMAKQDLPQPSKRTKGPRYTPVAKRQDKPDGVDPVLLGLCSQSELNATVEKALKSAKGRERANQNKEAQAPFEGEKEGDTGGILD